MSNRRQGASKMYQGAISTPSIKFWTVVHLNLNCVLSNKNSN